MTGLPRIAAAVVTGTAAVMTVAGASPAEAHGTLERPASRTSVCGTEGDARDSAVCAAALKASGRTTMPDWDNLRVADVGGRDREVIPDGKLCSAGIAEFAGLDLARRDWPTTTLKAGATYRFDYRATIPHGGSFRLYVTKDGYDPTRPLTWADLETKPFLTVHEPQARDGAYTLSGRLPKDKSGRHVIYTVWQNSDTPDTYYSCSDVVFRGAKATSSGAAKPAKTPRPAAATPAASASSGATAIDATATAARESKAGHDATDGSILPMLLVGLATVGVAGGIVLAALRSRRRRP